MQGILKFLRAEHGQDLVEYSLVVAFVALASAGLFLGTGGSVNAIWRSSDVTLSNAASSVGAPTSTATSSGTGSGTGNPAHCPEGRNADGSCAS